MNNASFFLELETRVWEALTTGNAQADENLLSPDFLGVYSTGFSERAAHVEQLACGPIVRSYSLENARFMQLGEGVVLLSYQAKWSRYGAEGPQNDETTYISSIWKRVNDVWQNVFSQDTQATK
ncbi:MAG: nuclear transport factor 2 family protein [Burkholderiaceae bacterium]|jgi:hypothetical protein